ncbi:HIT domain-containing protein [Candidatus Saccharibacteria bacterium]|nr:HIT domain-containing protein [Candidatus Saccharibacteria bacterium]
MQQPSIFTRIINGEIPCHKIYEDDRVLAFLTTNPVADGHTLVVPKTQVDQIWDLEPNDYDYLWKTAQKIALHLRTVMDVDRVGVVVKGFEVPHTHIHLIPVSIHSGISFDPDPPASAADDDALAAIAERIRL